MNLEQRTPANVVAVRSASRGSPTLPAETDSVVSGFVLVIDDEAEMRSMVADYFESHGMPTKSVGGRKDVARYFANAQPSLVILDLQLGEDDGLEVMKDIRQNSDVPIVIVTAHRQSEIDRVLGLELGADDYLTKPFSLRELLARVRAVLRRQEMARTSRTRDPERGGYRFKGWQLERRGRRLLDPKGNRVWLTKGEYALLLAFLQAPQRPLSREHLLQATRMHDDIFDRSIDVQVLRLRRKLEIEANAPQPIRTERGVGYTFAAEVESF